MEGVIESGGIEAAVRTFRAEGWLVVRALFGADEVALFRETFMEQAASGPIEGLSDGHWRDCAPGDPLRTHPRMMHPHRHPDLPVGPLALGGMLDPRLECWLEALHGEPMVAAQSMFYFKPAGSRGQDLHQDNYYLRVAPRTCCAMWLAIDDADQGNGGLLVVPGTARLPIACPTKADPALYFTGDHVEVETPPVPVDLRAGDVLFFNGSLVHGSSPNRSPDRWRRAFICHYVPRATATMSHWYECIGFDGLPVPFPDATGGGPCGDTGASEKYWH